MFTHKTRPSPCGALERPRKRTMFGCRHSRMMRHSRSKYLCTYTISTATHSRAQARPGVWLSSAEGHDEDRVRYTWRDAHAHIVFARREYLLDSNVDTEVCPWS
jgi:hypothetical protein